MNKIYLITTVHIEYPVIIRRRTVGWFPTLKIAEEVVVNNYGDIYECGYYNHCVVEEVVSGLYPHVTRKEWFKWVKDRYILVPKPNKIRVGNIGIG